MYRDEKWDPSYGIGLMFSKIDNSVDYFLAELDKDSISNESYDENRVLLHYITDCMIFSLLDKKDCNRVVIELIETICSAITTVALLVWLYKINK